jgi:hypothetical protein
MTATVAGDQRSKPYPAVLARLYAPRACYRCHAEKPAEAFDMGPSNRRRLRVCRDCLAAERAEREQMQAALRATWTDPHTGVRVRRCRVCREVKPLGAEFYVQNPKRHNPDTRRSYECRACTVARTTEYHREQPVTDRLRAQRKAQQARARAKRKADAARTERQRANARAAHRRRQIARGAPVRPPATDAEVRRYRNGIVGGAIPEERRLPSAPLVAALERLGARAGGLNRGEICARYGAHEKALYEWSRGARPMLDAETADRILVNTPLFWWDVWPEGSEGYDRACKFFTGAVR